VELCTNKWQICQVTTSQPFLCMLMVNLFSANDAKAFLIKAS